MRNLENQIAAWRQSLSAKLPAEIIEELELHLRETIQEQLRNGASESDALQFALNQIGSAPQLANEFQKVERRLWWPVKAATVAISFLALGLLVFLALRFPGRPFALVLGAHVFTITLGYVSVFLLGGMAICAVAQRSVSDLTPPETRSLKKAFTLFSAIAVTFTALGVGLSMIWAQKTWGASWSWDPKEIGGLIVLIWSLFFLAAQRSKTISLRALTALAIAGNIVVGSAWFVPNSAAPHGYGPPNLTALSIVILPSLLAMVFGLLPAGCLAPQKSRAA